MRHRGYGVVIVGGLGGGGGVGGRGGRKVQTQTRCYAQGLLLGADRRCIDYSSAGAASCFNGEKRKIFFFFFFFLVQNSHDVAF